jgi:hypothetical protein
MLELILKWNNTWQYDFWWREKYNIAFNSLEHRSVSQIDIKFDWLEKRLAIKQATDLEKQQQLELQFIKDGKWLKTDDKEKKMLDKINLDSIKSYNG